MFKRVEYQILEVEKGSKLPELTADLKESLRALQHVPAFQYLIMKLRYDKAAVEKSLRDGLFLPEAQLRGLQAGCYWLEYLEREINSLTKGTTPPRPSTPTEAQEFEAIRQQIELIA